MAQEKGPPASFCVGAVCVSFFLAEKRGLGVPRGCVFVCVTSCQPRTVRWHWAEEFQTAGGGEGL